MTQGNVDHDLQNSEFRIPSATVVQVLNIKNATYGKLCMLAYGNTVPSDAVVGIYGIGCIFFHTDGGNASALYVNEGTEASCDFNAIVVA